MKLGDFYSEFYSSFEPQFQEFIASLPSNTLSIDASSIPSFFEPLSEFIKGGKRIRPYLIAIGADSLDTKVIHAGVAFETIHTFILIHDDIMDGARKRRETDTVHVAFEKNTSHGEWGAMLLGDYLSSAANEYVSKYVPELSEMFYEMEKFLFAGQYYELLHWGKEASRELSEKIEYFKSAQYTFMYPLRMGLVLSARDIHMFDAYAKYVGLAFQMRDDWLDISGGGGKDVGLDSKNNVPNTVQLLLSQNNGNIEKTRGEVERLLGEYKDGAMSFLSGVDISERQKGELRHLVEFCTTLE